MTWNGFEIVCIEMDEESDYKDQRAIKTIGILSPSLTEKSADVVWSIQRKKLDEDVTPYVHVNLDGRVKFPRPMKEGSDQYLTLTGGLSETDPLLSLPSVIEYRKQEQFSKFR